MINWIKHLFRYRPKFKVGAIIMEKRFYESWQENEVNAKEILQIGKHSYQWKFLNYPKSYTSLFFVIDDLYEIKRNN